MDQVFFDDEVREILTSIGVNVVGETSTDLICLCPFHHNTDSPAFTISKISGLYMCHNPSCRESSGGSIKKLIMFLSGKSPFEAMRFISNKKTDIQKTLSEKIEDIQKEESVRHISDEAIEELMYKFWGDPRPVNYMRGRGFSDDTLEFFRVGYAPEKDMIVVPVYDQEGVAVGVNGRSIEGKTFKLTKSMPRNRILFNLNNAKKHGGTAIVCESQFDVMRIHQAGFPNAICFFGSHVSQEQAKMIQRYFDRVIIMTDADSAGREAGKTLSRMLRGRKVEWAVHGWGTVYPHGAKDAGDMTDEEISHCIKSSVSDVAYQTYRPLAKHSPV